MFNKYFEVNLIRDLFLNGNCKVDLLWMDDKLKKKIDLGFRENDQVNYKNMELKCKRVTEVIILNYLRLWEEYIVIIEHEYVDDCWSRLKSVIYYRRYDMWNCEVESSIFKWEVKSKFGSLIIRIEETKKLK